MAAVNGLRAEDEFAEGEFEQSERFAPGPVGTRRRVVQAATPGAPVHSGHFISTRCFAQGPPLDSSAAGEHNRRRFAVKKRGVGRLLFRGYALSDRRLSLAAFATKKEAAT